MRTLLRQCITLESDPDMKWYEANSSLLLTRIYKMKTYFQEFNEFM